jgi:hypothetical protein
MKNRLFPGISFIVLGLLIAIGPFTIFQVCKWDMMIMKCFWTARAELGAGILIAILGILTLLFASSRIRLGLSISAALNGILVLLIPTVLIGVCEESLLPCRVLTLPSLVILSSILIVISFVNVIVLLKKED